MKLFAARLFLGALVASSSAAVSQENSTTLAALRDHYRVLLVFANGDNAKAEKQLTIAAGHADGFNERDLLLVGLSGTNAAVPTAALSVSDDAAARKRFHVAAGQFTVLLIGKDGGEKLRSHMPFSWSTLQSTIDAMPMRRDEMKGSGKR